MFKLPLQDGFYNLYLPIRGDHPRFGWNTNSGYFSFSGLAFISSEVTSPQVGDKKFEGLLHTVNIDGRLVESYLAQQVITRNSLSAQWSFSCRPQRCCNLTGRVTLFRLSLFGFETKKTYTFLEIIQWPIIKWRIQYIKRKEIFIFLWFCQLPHIFLFFFF